MDTNKKIRIELLKSLRNFSENYNTKPYNRQKNSNSNDQKKDSNENNNLNTFSSDLIKVKKMNSGDINLDSFQHKYQHHHSKKSPLKNYFNEKNQFDKNTNYKSQDKPIKINLVSQKFKIADDFNEKNSNQFLKEKDECLREIILTDKIKEDESLHFYFENEKGNIYELSPINKNKNNENLNFKLVKRKIVEDDSVGFLSKLIEDLK